MIHKIKIEQKFFYDIASGLKSFDVRKNDRNYAVGDTLEMFEIDENMTNTGRGVIVRVNYILPGGKYGIEENYCVMGITNPKTVKYENT